MMNQTARKSILDLRENSTVAYLGSSDSEGYPAIRAMLVLEHDALRTQYFSTNTSSGKVTELLANPKASVYYCRPEAYEGVLFIGEMEVCHDQPTKDFLWREGFERYYPEGVTDPDYCVLKFTAKRGRIYGGPNKMEFGIDEVE